MVLGFLGLDLWEPQIDSSKSEVPQAFISFLFIFWNPCKVGIDIIVVSIVEKNELGKGV